MQMVSVAQVTPASSGAKTRTGLMNAHAAIGINRTETSTSRFSIGGLRRIT